MGQQVRVAAAAGAPFAHLFLDVVERVGRVNGKADENDVRVGVGERAQAAVTRQLGAIGRFERVTHS